MQRILVIFTGGTISSGLQGDRTGPDVKASESLHQSVRAFFQNSDIEVICREPWGIPGLDSSDLDPVHWVELTGIIAEEMKKGLRGVMILHGTDTMAWTSAWLSLCFPRVSIPVVLTGSQLTLDYMPDDVTVNLRGAAQVTRSDMPGVWIYFDWKLIPGDRAHKARATHPDAYVALNAMPVYFNPEWAMKVGNAPSCSEGGLSVTPLLEKVLSRRGDETRTLCRKIGWLTAMPGVYGSLVGDEQILCVLGFGAGNAPSDLLQYIRSTYSGGHRPHIIACSQAEEETKKPGNYRDVGIASLADDGFTVWGQMDYPIEFIHSLACYSLLATDNAPGFVLSRYLKQF